MTRTSTTLIGAAIGLAIGLGGFSWKFSGLSPDWIAAVAGYCALAVLIGGLVGFFNGKK